MDVRAQAPKFAYAAFRVILGLIMVEHGLMKLLAFPAAAPGVPSPLPPLLVFAGVLETVGGALLAAGLLARLAAFVLSGEMAVGYFMVHAPNGFWPSLNGGDLAVLLCFALLFFAAHGAGPWSVGGRGTLADT